MDDQNSVASVGISAELEADFERATQGQLTDDDIERARLLVGIYTASKARELFSVATPDAIRNWALGAGDDNPLYTDENYGLTTRWGSQVGHGTMMGHIKTPMLGDPISSELAAQTKDLFSGVQAFVSGGSWEWFRPLWSGDRIYCYSGEDSLEVNKSNFAGRSVSQVRRDVVLNHHGEVLGIHRTLRILAERKTAKNRGKYASIEPAHYSPKDYERIDEIYASEQPRGRDIRYWEDVQIGEALPAMVKGPLTVTEMIAFHCGGYGFVLHGLPSSRLAYKLRKRVPTFFVKNESGVFDVDQRIHWDSQWARAIGNPMAFDYGVMRECWFYHYVSDWMGNDAFIEEMTESIRKFNYIGDTQFLSGHVSNKRVEDERYLIDLELNMVSQRDTETATASVTLSLTSRDAGLTPMRLVPVSLQREAASIFARHNELTASQASRTYP